MSQKLNFIQTSSKSTLQTFLLSHYNNEEIGLKQNQEVPQHKLTKQ